MATAMSSTNRDAADDRGQVPSTTDRRSRDRRRAQREVCRALSEFRAIAIWTCLIVFGHIAGYGLLAGEQTLALVAGVLALGCFLALSAHAEPGPDRGPKGEIARMSEPAFEDLLESVQRDADLLASGATAASGAAPASAHGDGVARLVGEALDELPGFLRAELERNVAVVVSDDGSSHGAHGYYGLYVGGTVANRGWDHRIVIFRDTLERDFGNDPETLRRQVALTVRHELAHHLGAGERHVAELGLSDVRYRGPRDRAARGSTRARAAPRRPRPRHR